MTTSPIDLFFSLRGRITLQEGLIGMAILAIAGPAGVYFFNNDNFDQSANAIASAPTMAAFLWALLCVFAMTALCAKRLSGWRRWLAAVFAIPGLLILCGWGLGYFQAPLSPLPDSIVLWTFGITASAAIVSCLRGDVAA
ncbi:hypothetical protein [Hyphomicrobium sp.]|uniref:hypothetical protein n=1 Tax=Hyphomicrobium sp. TaxID=82 RepID=UPI002E329070|nr:hypothetical protein [Hyphomicrobium sp.]HEX2842537.1 hypothetical protein [Hyphomicrobium sp.]